MVAELVLPEYSNQILQVCIGHGRVSPVALQGEHHILDGLHTTLQRVRQGEHQQSARAMLLPSIGHGKLACLVWITQQKPQMRICTFVQITPNESGMIDGLTRPDANDGARFCFARVTRCCQWEAHSVCEILMGHDGFKKFKVKHPHAAIRLGAGVVRQALSGRHGRSIGSNKSAR